MKLKLLTLIWVAQCIFVTSKFTSRSSINVSYGNNMARSVEIRENNLTECHCPERIITEVQQARQNLAEITELGGRKYYFSTRQIGNWFEASTYCNLIGMDLLSIETKAENDLIMAQINNLGLTNEWILTGGNKIGQTCYAWISGASMTFVDWNQGDPASFNTENCLMLNRGHWSDLGCHQYHVRFICEQI